MTILDANLTFQTGLSARSRTDTILLHHAEAKTASVQDIHRWHLKNGWSGIGYHYYVRKDGSIYHGRPENTVGAHAGNKSGYNGRSIGICFEGDYMHDAMPAAQLAAGRALIGDIQKRHKSRLNILAHRDVCATDCPGIQFPFSQFKKDIEDDEEDNEMVKQMKMCIDGQEYIVDAIEKDGANYIKLRSLEQAGYGVSYDEAESLPGLLAPDTRSLAGVPLDEKSCDALQKRADLDPKTIAYLARYAHGDALLQKLAGMA